MGKGEDYVGGYDLCIPRLARKLIPEKTLPDLGIRSITPTNIIRRPPLLLPAFHFNHSPRPFFITPHIHNLLIPQHSHVAILLTMLQ